jgi:uncharacterized integral membrane protein
MPASQKRRGAGDWLAQAKTIGLIVLVVLVIVVVVKNDRQTEFWFFGWGPRMPLALMLFAAFLIGLAAGAWGLRRRRK